MVLDLLLGISIEGVPLTRTLGGIGSQLYEFSSYPSFPVAARLCEATWLLSSSRIWVLEQHVFLVEPIIVCR